MVTVEGNQKVGAALSLRASVGDGKHSMKKVVVAWSLILMILGGCFVTLATANEKAELATNPDPPEPSSRWALLYGESGNGSFNITNCGGGTLYWEAVSDTPWLSVNPSTGSLSAGDTDPVAVTIDTTYMWVGENEGSVYVTSNGGNKKGVFRVQVDTNDDSDNKQAIVRWVTDYYGANDDLDSADEDALGFCDELNAAGWSCEVNAESEDAWEVDFMAEYMGGNNLVDGYDLAAFAGHGSSGTLAFSYYDRADNQGWYDLYPWETKLGGRDLEWIGFSACEVLDTEDHCREWCDAMNGIHLICGWKTPMYETPDMLSSWIYRMKRGETVKNAWFHAGDDVDSWRTLRVIGKNETYGDDHLWGEGYVSPDLLQDDTCIIWEFDTGL